MTSIPNIPVEYVEPLMAFWESGSSHVNRTSSASQAGVDQVVVDRLVEDGYLIAVPQFLLGPQYYMREDVAYWASVMVGSRWSDQ
jgi:hypothetical protein